MTSKEQAPTIRLSDYQPPAYLVDTVQLTFDLDPTATRVTSVIAFRRNPAAGEPRVDLHLDGRELQLVSAAIDGKTIPLTALSESSEGLIVPATELPDDTFMWSCETLISPAANTALEGLYMSGGMYCTQCEPQGFRKITYYPDRPDVMARFSVRINGALPVMLSNGNPTAQGDGWAEWQDPWPKPAYLFALVAGELVSFDDHFTTASGRAVDLKIWVRDGDRAKCEYAMDALKRSMRWDEVEYGREYDLDLFQIVAVDDFNMGAMENKGLNIFNSKYVLASPETATDRDFEMIEGIIAHEYFHNWTGNRITCRDWFQLCLKEGLTVFRDQQFSGDQRSHAVKRIDDVVMLRARQFREDAGPLAHPVRPEEYIEINNFYTATVYEKGAEVIGMLRKLVGSEAYREALDLYFDRHDGQACTIEDWLQIFEDSTGRDLSQFALWYRQAGTPVLDVAAEFDDGTYTLTFSQKTASTPGQTSKSALVIPIAVGLLNDNGDEIVPTTILEMTQDKQSFDFTGLAAQPIPSILRGLSAPVILNRDITSDERAFLLAHDTDPFNKWEAGRTLARAGLTATIIDKAAPDPVFLAAMGTMLRDKDLDPAFRAMTLMLPGEDDLAQSLHQGGAVPDPLQIHSAREGLATALSRSLEDDLFRIYNDMEVQGDYSPDPTSAAKRSLRAACLGLLSRLDGGRRAQAQFAAAGNMTEQLTALAAIMSHADTAPEGAAFFDQWRHDRLVVDKWFTLSAQCAPAATAAAVVEGLTHNKDFDWKNPNRFRSLLGGFVAGNPAGFHRADGAGYDLYAKWLMRLDPINPQTTARMCTAFETWQRYDADRQAQMRAALQRIADAKDLSKDSAEMVGRILDG